MIPRPLRAAGLAAALAASLAACGAPFPTNVPRVTPAPDATGSGTHVFPGLEARLPAEISGVPLLTASISTTSGTQDPKTLEVLRRLGKTVGDLQLARANSPDLDLEIGALRIVGADAREAARVLQAVDEEDPGHTAVYEPLRIAGRDTTTRTTDQRIEYIYPVEDILFILSGDRMLVEEALGQL